MKKTTFAFDFDNTISRDPESFYTFMEELRDKGHNVYVVTARRPNIFPDDFDEVMDRGFTVIKTRHIAKRLYMREVEGIEVDVWIDDCPEAVTENWEGAPRTFRDFNDGTQCVQLTNAE
jgi:hypothetical protein